MGDYMQTEKLGQIEQGKKNTFKNLFNYLKKKNLTAYSTYAFNYLKIICYFVYTEL